MQDRISVNPGRVLISPENGAPYYATMTRADNATQEGTPLNKNSLLRDATAALFGLGADAAPDDVLSVLSPVVKHWWSRWVPGTMSWQEVRSGTSWNVQINNKSYNYTWEYADAININQNDGTVSLINATSITISSGQSESVVKNAFQKLKGKYCHSYDTSSDYILYFPGDADQYLSWGNNTLTVQAGHAFTISSVYASTPIGDKTFLSSANRDAYPDSGVVDGYEYSYLGIPWENARTPVRIATGSYTGTGTYGSGSKNSLTFNFEPKIFFINGIYDYNGIPCFVINFKGDTKFHSFPESDASGITWDGLTVSWYHSRGAANQCNASGKTYTYVAIG